MKQVLGRLRAWRSCLPMCAWGAAEDRPSIATQRRRPFVFFRPSHLDLGCGVIQQCSPSICDIMQRKVGRKLHMLGHVSEAAVLPDALPQKVVVHGQPPLKVRLVLLLFQPLALARILVAPAVATRRGARGQKLGRHRAERWEDHHTEERGGNKQGEGGAFASEMQFRDPLRKQSKSFLRPSLAP